MMSLHMGAAGSVVEGKAMAVYLLEQQIPKEAMRSAAYYGQTKGIEEAIAEGYGTTPTLRVDIDPALGEALGLKAGQSITIEDLSNILSGRRADGEALPGQHQHQGVTSYGGSDGQDFGDHDDEVGGKIRHRVAYLDLTLSAPKHLGVAWAFAKTEAERNSLLQAHKTSVQKTLRYIEQQVIRARMGDGGALGHEYGRAAWITVDHYTARPTQERVCTDPTTGETYTDLHSAKVAGDPALHTHCLVPNLILTESGRFAALDSAAFHGRVHEFGAVYQAILVHELRAMGVDAGLDPRTNMARLPAIPEHVVEEFSKRSREGEAAARKRAEKEGREWDLMTPEQQATYRKLATHATRLDKETNTPDWDAWHQQAKRIGWEHTTAISPTPLPVRLRDERMNEADAVGLEQLSGMLVKKAVIGQGEARLAIARGFIAAGGLENTAAIGQMAKHWAKGHVLQDGLETKLIWKEVGLGRIKLTTELHRDQEQEFIRLARKAVTDRYHALAAPEISAAVIRTGFSYQDEHGLSQLRAVDTVGTDGALSVVIGVAGSGKSTGVLSPLVDAWKARGLEVWGTAQAWRQAKDLRSAGIDNAQVRALDPFLDAMHDGRIKLGRNSVVVLDEVGRIGTRQLLDMLRLREQHGFKLAVLGDDEQAQAIEAGPVIDLLRRALGEERIPQILTTIRQEKDHEQDLANMFRNGEVGEAIEIKRADGTAELVHGGYRDAIQRVADLYMERRLATRDRPKYRITISAPTNADVHEISRVVREQRRAIGEIGPDLAKVGVTDGNGNAATLDLAVGDRVRLFSQTRGVFVDARGRRRAAVVGDNGSVLEVVGVDVREGLHVRGESGKVSFVPWERLKDRNGSNRLRLGSGEVLTIDSSQGITSHEHIDALPAGSAMVNGFKAYVAASRHRVRHYLVGSMGAELREVHSRRMSGLPKMSPQEAQVEAWQNLVRNLEKRPKKESAIELLETTGDVKRQSTKSLQRALVRHEARELAGDTATTVRERQENKAINEGLPQIAEDLQEIARQRAEVVASLKAAHEYWGNKENRRLEVAARLVCEGDMPFDEALHRIVSAELQDRNKGIPVDPLHGTRKMPKETEDPEALERRLEMRLLDAIDAHDARQAMQTAAPTPVETQRAGETQSMGA